MPEAILISLRLSKEGFGRPDEILAMRADLVLAALEYVKFETDYEHAYLKLNDPKT